MDLSGNQTNPLYAQLQPYVDNSYGAVSRTPHLCTLLKSCSLTLCHDQRLALPTYICALLT